MRKNKNKFVKILYKDKFINKNTESRLDKGRLDSFRLK